MQTNIQDRCVEICRGEEPHVYMVPLSAEQLEKVSFEAARAMMLRAFGGAHRFQFFIAGALPEDDELASLLQSELGDLSNLAANQAWLPIDRQWPRELPSTFPAKSAIEVVYKGEDEKARVRGLYGGRLVPGAASQKLAAAIGHLLETRLMERLRTEMAKVYSVSCWTDVASPVFSDSVVITIFAFTCHPADANSLSREAAKILGEFGMPTDAEVEASRQQVLSRLSRQSQSV